MNLFRTFLVIMILAIFAYTAIVGVNHGWNLIRVFFGEILAMTWSGQFNFDFLCLLLLCGLWTSWRNSFTPKGLDLGALAIFFGVIFLAPYLLILSFKENGDAKAILVGAR